MNKNVDIKVDRISEELKGKKIAYCISGGIASIEAPKIIRHLRRHGAVVKVYATPSSLSFIGRASLEWASGKEIIVELSGLAEHICQEDLVLVSPATLNTINKISLGIADNNVTSLIASALGSEIPIYLCPTMHLSLHKNPFFQKNLRLLKENNVNIIEPRISEDKAKIPKIKDIVNKILCHFEDEK